MRTLIVFVFVAICETCFAIPQGFVPYTGPERVLGGVDSVPESRWDYHRENIKTQLKKLKEQQGHNFELVSIENVRSQVISGIKTSIEGTFQNPAGENVSCSILDIDGVGFRQFSLSCPQGSFEVFEGTRPSWL